MVAICCFPFCIQAFLQDGWIYGHYLCQFNGFLAYYRGGISVQTLALTAVNRYFRMVKSQIYTNYFTIKSTVLMILAMWVLTLISGVIILNSVGPVIYEYDPRFFFCIATYTSKKHRRAIGISLHLIHVFIPLIIIVYCYWNVFRTIRHNVNFGPSLRAGRQRQVAMNTWELRVTKLLFLVVLGFFVCRTPVIIIGLLAHSSTLKLPDFAPELYTVLAFTSAVINPFIYGVANRNFRREFLGFFHCR